jgi:hypothetical protein
MSSCLFNKVKTNLNKVNDINSKLYLVKSLLTLTFWITKVFTIFIDILIDIWENKNNWYHKQIVDGKNCNEEVPELAESSFSVYQVPLKFRLTVDDLILFISIFVNIVNHHFFQI